MICWRLASLSYLGRLLTSSGRQGGHRHSSARSASSALQSDVAKQIVSDVTEGSEPTTVTVDSDGIQLSVDRRSKFAFYLDSNVRKDIDDGLYTPSKHPGRRTLPSSKLPEELTNAVKIVMEGSLNGELVIEAKKFRTRIWDRHGPLEESVKEEKEQAITQKIISKEEVDPLHPAVSHRDKKQLLKEREQIFKKRLRSEMMNYRFIDFSSRKSGLLYILARLDGDYAALVKAFHNLRLALPQFTPRTVMDFGSGLGSVTWAVDKIWPQMCQESFNVDASEEMNLLNESLCKGGSIEGKFTKRPHSTFFRQFLPASGSIKHDLVVSSRSLFDLPNRETRLRTLDILWKTVSPGGCIVVVEAGNRRGCEYILEAREFLLEGVDASRTYNRGKVIAPCPHQMTCPLNAKPKNYRICSDCCKYEDTFLKNTSLEIFSYIIVQKPLVKSREDTRARGCSWPRVVQPVLRPSRQNIMRVCNSAGALQELSACKGKHSSSCVRVAKKTELGDLFPVTLLPEDQHLKTVESLFKKVRRQKKEQAISMEENLILNDKN